MPDHAARRPPGSLERAIEIAARGHAGQTDKAGAPYILHPLRVMLRLADEAGRIAAILHDVGTLLLDLRILDKPALTAEDLEQVQTHPVLASTFLQGFQFPFDVLRIIRHHHERWDGKGYPDGIAEEAIPVESRIIHLVESYQVMTTGTAYRSPRPAPAAMAELRLLAGQKYDPRMVEEFIQMVEEDRRRE